MLELESKYAIDTRIEGWFKATYLELNETHRKISTHLKLSRNYMTNGLIVIAPAYDYTEDSSV
jgi:hypothetical protein